MALKKVLCDSTGNRHTCPKAELMAGSAALMQIMMAELAKLISTDFIFAKTHLYPGE